MCHLIAVSNETFVKKSVYLEKNKCKMDIGPINNFVTDTYYK